jgi:serine beta-lactamase-like protein LACTB, mitochondrial
VARSRTQIVLALIVTAVGLLVAAILGLFAYVSLTATPIHPDPLAVRTVTESALPKWAGAVERGRQIVRAGLVEQNLPGISVAVGARGEIVWAEGFGWADLEMKTPVAPDLRFRIGTASTVLTSAAVGLLLEKDRLKLDDQIQTHVTDFPKKQWPVTLRQIMGHVAGIRPDEGDEEDVTARCERTTDGLQRFARYPLLFEPGTQFRYSTYGWILVSAAIEAAATEGFSTFMQKQIFERLAMNDTVFDAAPAATEDRATYYFPRFAADPRYGPQEPTPVDYSCFSGSSGFLSTPSDLVRFGMAMDSRLRQGSGAHGGGLLKPATVQLLQTSQRLPSGEETGYGLGWDLETVTLAGEQRRLVVHDGDLRGGRVATFMTFPERGIVVAVTSNTSFADTQSIALRVAEAFAK